MGPAPSKAARCYHLQDDRDLTLCESALHAGNATVFLLSPTRQLQEIREVFSRNATEFFGAMRELLGADDAIIGGGADGLWLDVTWRSAAPVFSFPSAASEIG
jgi:hypothetical protein